MSRSFAQPVELACSHCDERFAAEVWLVVNTAERPKVNRSTRKNLSGRLPNSLN
jgi:hypothetical protein